MSETAAATPGVNMSNLRGGMEHASQWRLMWYRFRKHRVAVACTAILLVLYCVVTCAEFFAPSVPEGADDQPDATYKTADFVGHPPQMIYFDGMQPYVKLYHMAYEEVEDAEGNPQPTTVAKFYKSVDVGFFVRGAEYSLFGIRSNLHFFGPTNPHDRMYLLGADALGRDTLTRIIYGSRFTMWLGMFGVFLSMILGIIFGGVAGYYGGKTDWIIQRITEFIISLPTIPIWLAMAAALPKNMPPYVQYFAITVIVSLLGWTSLARVVRGRFLALRTEVFVVAAKLDGCSEARVIFRHMLPSLMSHIIAAVTLAIPNMIIAETSLSFLGLGLQPPAISLGVLLGEAKQLSTLFSTPWMLFSGLMVVLVVLSFNFMGDGLRDAADPYSH